MISPAPSPPFDPLCPRCISARDHVPRDPADPRPICAAHQAWVDQVTTEGVARFVAWCQAQAKEAA